MHLDGNINIAITYALRRQDWCHTAALASDPARAMRGNDLLLPFKSFLLLPDLVCPGPVALAVQLALGTGRQGKGGAVGQLAGAAHAAPSPSLAGPCENKSPEK